MQVLLDTHVALWAITNDERLVEKGRRIILNDENDVFVSVASIWEIAIKHGLGRGVMPISGNEANEWFRVAGYRILPVEAQHAANLETLPRIHGDPFDRILVSQALLEPPRLLTHDKIIAQYSDTVILI